MKKNNPKKTTPRMQIHTWIATACQEQTPSQLTVWNKKTNLPGMLRCLIDSGATVNVIPRKYVHTIIEGPKVQLKMHTLKTLDTFVTLGTR